MSCYTVSEKNSENLYKIVENNRQVVDIKESKRTAHRICRGLNLGKGFDGFTPDFFCERIPINGEAT